ncbi:MULTISPECIES: hypothetical protein [unclassified Bradyrhizobium]|uniref:hypothetical protein n=1 Tax=unclassified Bradyrhizobium TaxID=2631580 RepID=UPI0029163E3B|nr:MULTISPECIES: hypothetical protein [unclassified Bradyrhizobium]
MSYDLIGPSNAPNSVTTRPADSRATNGAVVGAADTWFQDCTSPTANDGTKVMAAWLNGIMGQLRNAIRGNGNLVATSQPVVTESDADDAMLLKAMQYLIQRGKAKFAQDTGTASNVVVTLSPPPPELVEGMVMAVKMAAAPVGPTTINVNGSGPLPAVRRGGYPTIGSDWNAGDYLLWIYTAGAKWMAVGFLQSDIPGGVPLQANADWYVNASTGSDTLYDGTAATVSGSHGPFASIQRALQQCAKYNMNGFNQTVHVADGNYSPIITPTINGTGNIFITGNNANPQNCAITNTSPNGVAITASNGYIISGFRLSSTGVNALDGIAVGGGQVTINNMRFGPCTRYHVMANPGGSIILGQGTFAIEAGATTTAHLAASSGGSIGPTTGAGTVFPTLVILGVVSINQWIYASYAGSVQMAYASVTGASNVTGAKYAAIMNGTIGSYGVGVNAFPGSTAGTTNTGGQYS